MMTFGQRILIQFQDINGNWITVNSIDDSNGQYVAARMNEAASSRPGHRVRAISESGLLIDVR
jgi:hypothetical protein